jgi:hypothetical protein
MRAWIIRNARTSLFLAAVSLVLSSQAARAADFAVTSPGFFYSINGTGSNPNLTLVRGKTYTFQVSASSIHPFFINSPGVQNNNISSGTITYTVPMAASNYVYFCSIHGFGGKIETIAPTPPTPPRIQLLSLSLGSNLVLSSTGTNNWSVKPEYSTNLAGTNWYALTVITNRFVGGTNETICGIPPAPGAFIRIQSQPN